MPQVPLLGPQRYGNETLRQSYYQRIKPGFLESLKAAVTSDFVDTGPTSSALRMGEMNDALGLPQQWEQQLQDINAQVGIPRRDEIAPAPVTPMSEAEWKASPDYRPGLSYMQGLTKEAAKLLAERYDARQIRNDVMSREPGGIVRTPVMFAARLAAMAADPLNLLSAFVPVVSEVQGLRLAAQLGRFGGRFARGAIEGTVGTALLEPIVLGAARQDQTDYTVADSLSNIGMGGLFGAAAHSVGGAVADWLRGRGPKAHVAATDVAIKQAAAGQDIDVTPILKAAPEETPQIRGAISGEGDARISAARSAERQQIATAREQIRLQRQADAAKPMTFDERRAQAKADLERNFPAGTVKSWKGGDVRWSGPMDIVSYIRTLGGISKNDADYYIPGGVEQYSKGRRIEFAGKENFLGPLVREGGKGLDVLATSLREAGYLRDGTVEELVDAIDQTLRSGGNLEKRVWGASDNASMAVRDYADTLRSIDEEEFTTAPMPDRYEPLLADEEDYPFDPVDLEDMDSPEAMLSAAEEAYEPKTPETGPKAAGEKAPVDPEIADAEARAAGFTAAAACIGRALG